MQAGDRTISTGVPAKGRVVSIPQYRFAVLGWHHDLTSGVWAFAVEAYEHVTFYFESFSTVVDVRLRGRCVVSVTGGLGVALSNGLRSGEVIADEFAI